MHPLTRLTSVEAALAHLQRYEDHRFTRRSRESVAAGIVKANQRRRALDYVQACAERVHVTGDYCGPTWAAILDVEQGGGPRDHDSETGWPQLPAVAWPSQEWLGGSIEQDSWKY